MIEKIEKSLLELDFAGLTRRTFTPSPAAWEDQVLYFLLLDRFSDGKEKGGYRDNEDRPVPTGGRCEAQSTRAATMSPTAALLSSGARNSSPGRIVRLPRSTFAAVTCVPPTSMTIG